MKKLLAVFIAAFALVAMSLPALSEVSGVVVNKDGKPIAKAKLVISVGAQGKWETDIVWTDKNGKFSFTSKEEPKDGSFSIQTIANGYTGNYAYGKMDESKGLKLMLWPELETRIRVVDENKQPIAGATVSYNCQAYDGRSKRTDFHSDYYYQKMQKPQLTDKNGIFVLHHIPNPRDFKYGSLGVAVSKKDRATIYGLRIEMKDIKAENVIVQPLEARLEGTLYLPERSGVAPEETEISIRRVNTEDERTVQVGQDGKFVFYGLIPGKYNIFLGPCYMLRQGPNGRITPEQKPWIFPAIMNIDLVAKQTKTIQIDTVPTVDVKGIATFAETGKPVVKAIVSATHPGRPQDTTESTTLTNDKGEFTMRVAPGNVTLRMQDYGEGTYSRSEDLPTVSFDIAAGQTKSDVVLNVETLSNFYSISKDQRKPIPQDLELTPGTYDLSWNPFLDCEYAEKHDMICSGEKAKAMIKKCPSLVSETPRYAAFRFDGSGDDGLIVAAIDESRGTGKGWDTAYIDLNRNRDLTDDEPVHWKPNGDRHGYSSWVPVQAHQGKPGPGQISNPVKVRTASYVSGELYISLQSKGAWKGMIDTNKGKAECVLVDTNSNGLFGDSSVLKDNGEPISFGDKVYIDANLSGSIVLNDAVPHEFYLNPLAKIGNKFYKISANDIGNKITIQPYNGKMGQLIVCGSDINGMDVRATQLYASSQNGYYSLDQSGDTPLTLPVGKYRIMWCRLNAHSKDSRDINLGCQPDELVEVKADELATFTIGGKLSVAINPEKSEMVMKPNNSEKINWMIKIGDKATLTYISGGSVRNTPIVKFFDSKRKLVGTSTAGYT